ncbi:MAG: hypothetical protein ACJAYU_002534 [Bradymonadia bacterium]|jgi:hypothetical protein
MSSANIRRILSWVSTVIFALARSYGCSTEPTDPNNPIDIAIGTDTANGDSGADVDEDVADDVAEEVETDVSEDAEPVWTRMPNLT